MRRAWMVPAIVLACAASASAQTKPYKGAEVYTGTQYLYGRIEMRMQMARGSGILSTFFTYKQGSEVAGAFWEEIDIEVFGKNDATTWQSNIIVGNPRTLSEQVHTVPASLADAYHTYAIEWAPTYVAWSLDGVEVRRTTDGPASQLTNAQGLRFNLWASNAASWAGAFDAAALPQHQYVNWIRYYRYEGGAFVLDWEDNFDTFNVSRWGKANWTFDGNLVDFDPANAVVRDGTLVLCLTPAGQTGCTAAVPADTGGAPDAGTGGSDAGQPPGASDDGGCGCAMGGGRDAIAWTGASAIGLLALLGARRRRAAA